MFEPGVSRLNSGRCIAFSGHKMTAANAWLAFALSWLRPFGAPEVLMFMVVQSLLVEWNSWECNVRSRTRAVRGKTAEWSAMASGFKTCLCKVLRPASWNLTQNWRSWLVSSSHRRVGSCTVEGTRRCRWCWANPTRPCRHVV